MIHARVQHHPSRAHLLPGLLDRLAPIPCEIVAHQSDPPSPWAGYRLCLDSPPDCSHLLIVQDDALPVPGFTEALPAIARDVPVCLFLSRLPRDTRPKVEQAMRMNRRYLQLSLRSFLPVIAVLWPLPKLIEFEEWSRDVRLPGAHPPRSDDAVGGRWKLETRQLVLATVPSIVEHADEEPSVIRDLSPKAPRRKAAFLADDARDYDWSMP